MKRDLRDMNAEKRGSYNGKRDPNQKRSDHKKRMVTDATIEELDAELAAAEAAVAAFAPTSQQLREVSPPSRAARL